MMMRTVSMMWRRSLMICVKSAMTSQVNGICIYISQQPITTILASDFDNHKDKQIERKLTLLLIFYLLIF